MGTLPPSPMLLVRRSAMLHATLLHCPSTSGPKNSTTCLKILHGCTRTSPSAMPPSTRLPLLLLRSWPRLPFPALLRHPSCACSQSVPYPRQSKVPSSTVVTTARNCRFPSSTSHSKRSGRRSTWTLWSPAPRSTTLGESSTPMLTTLASESGSCRSASVARFIFSLGLLGQENSPASFTTRRTGSSRASSFLSSFVSNIQFRFHFPPTSHKTQKTLENTLRGAKPQKKSVRI
ncbi:hypothetical protein C8F01DRAFT_698139 [Mycena amicta]|nr:hypothetical protein C8F01DRAFT_698139 [Mycena amicta]